MCNAWELNSHWNKFKQAKSKRSVVCKKPLKRLKKAFGETPNTGLKSGANEKTRLLRAYCTRLNSYG